jgi:hypothetical protein
MGGFTIPRRFTCQLRVSPMGVVPQRERRPRVIVDYSFFGVNDDMVKLAPREAMQFGKALERILGHIVEAPPAHGPVYLLKIDIADGFYRIWLNENDILPLLFPCHRYMETSPWPTWMYLLTISLGCAKVRHHGKIKCAELFSSRWTKFFAPSNLETIPFGKSRHRRKRLAQGDGFWETRKLVLGWIIDTVAMTIELPAHRCDRLRLILDSIPPTQRRTIVRKWQQLLGELRSMAIAIPGSKGLFSWMQETLKHHSDEHIRHTRSIHDCIHNFKALDRDLTSRPTRLFELVPQDAPEILGASDACGYGLGGIAFPQPYARTWLQTLCDGELDGCTSHSPLQGTPGPIVWRYKLPSDITAKLVTFDNPKGTVTNSDLELLATVVQHDVLAQHFDVRERSVAMGTDNTPALSWQRKGTVSTTGSAAYLLCMQALHQRYHRYHLAHFFIPGSLNKMADDAS